MKTYTITITGKTQSDIEDALSYVQKWIEGGSWSGFDSNDSGSYDFKSEGDFEEEEEDDDEDVAA